MADTTTTTYGFTKPEVGASEDSWGDKLNTNLDTLDDLLDGTSTLQGAKVDDSFKMVDNADATKVVAFSASSLTTATTRTYTWPDASGEFVLLAATQTLTNKSLTAPTITGNLTFDGVAHTGTTGADTKLVSGTAGTTNNVAIWNSDGDVVDGGRKVSAYEFISSQDASASATLNFTGFDATKYDAYVFELMNIIPADDGANFNVRTSTDGGSTYDSGASDYTYCSHRVTNDGAATIGNTAATAAQCQLAPLVGSDTNEDGISGRLVVHGPHLTKRTMMKFDGSFINTSGQFVMQQTSGVRLSSADVDAIRFMFGTGSNNTESGTITMYGLRNS